MVKIQRFLFKHSYFFLILFLSCLAVISIFTTTDLFHSHDGLVHLPRIAAYYHALQDGQFPVRYAGDLNYGYGMPLFIFIYQTPYMIASLFLFLGASLVNSFKLSLSLSFILSGIFMYLFAKELFRDSQKAFLATVFYQFAPFRLVELLVRGSFGEVYTYAFLPLVLYGLVKLNKKVSVSHFILVSVSTALLVLSHNSISLVFFGVSSLFIFFIAKGKNILFLFASLVSGLLLSAYYWVPAILEHKYTYGDLFMKNIYKDHFPPLLNLFLPNFLNDPSLQTQGISVQIGMFHVATIFLALYFLFSKKVNTETRKLFFFSFFLIAAALFFMQQVSSTLWESVSLLRQFQFPWRFLSVVGFATSLLSVSFLFFSFFQKNIMFFVLVSLVVFSTVYYWKPSLGFDKIDEGYYWNFPLSTTYYGETDVIWSAGPAHEYPEQRVQVIGGIGTVSRLVKKSNLQTFEVNAITNVTVVSRTQYFPGWRAYIEKTPADIQFQDPNSRGLITFAVPKGHHAIRIEFGESPVRAVSDGVSYAAAAGLAILWGLAKRRSA